MSEFSHVCFLHCDLAKTYMVDFTLGSPDWTVRLNSYTYILYRLGSSNDLSNVRVFAACCLYLYFCLCIFYIYVLCNVFFTSNQLIVAQLTFCFLFIFAGYAIVNYYFFPFLRVFICFLVSILFVVKLLFILNISFSSSLPNFDAPRKFMQKTKQK